MPAKQRARSPICPSPLQTLVLSTSARLLDACACMRAPMPQKSSLATLARICPPASMHLYVRATCAHVARTYAPSQKPVCWNDIAGG
eukprot:685275-Pleurochrysis_carterae.AAC.4